MITRKFALLIAMFLLNFDSSAHSDAPIKWIDKTWEVRYMLFVWDQDTFKYAMDSARKLNKRQTVSGVEIFALEGRELFTQTNYIPIPGKKTIVTALIPFDKMGQPDSSSLVHGNWVARRDTLNALLLIDQSNPTNKPYYLADWSLGIPGDWSFSPAVCAGFDSCRYSDDWGLSDVFGGFGCREWTAQLYSWERPYIDVTSYDPDGPFIGEFVGWSRFTDPPKPVIGLQGKTWLCLHECPNGEKSGVIKDIKAWTKKHGFPMPERPPKQPLYPNADYLDDIHEFKD